MPASLDHVEPRAPEPRWWRALWVKTVIALLILIAAFDLAADWRGQARWKAVQAEAKAAGESLDPRTLIPPPVPADKNLATLPLFELVPDASGRLDAYRLISSLSKTGFLRSYPPAHRDAPEIERRVREEYTSKTGKPPSPGSAPLDLLAYLCPELADLRNAAPTHPECRFDEDYTFRFESRAGSYVAYCLQEQAQAFQAEEILALTARRPDLLTADLQVELELLQGLLIEPKLFNPGSCREILFLNLSTLQPALAGHLLTDAQLAQLDQSLGQIDFLAGSHRADRDAALVWAPLLIDHLKTNRFSRENLARVLDAHYDQWNPFQMIFAAGCLSFGPDGWFDETRADLVHFQLIDMVRTVDPAHHRAYPDRLTQSLAAFHGRPVSSMWGEWEFQFLKYWPKTISQLTQAQVFTDQARIACRLERYHLARGAYPASLNDLSIYGPLPTDPINGQPYHYHLNPNGSFFLYSVGWDQKDSGGMSGTTSPLQNLDAADWIWSDLAN